MNIQQVLHELDQLYANKKIGNVETYLLEKIDQSKQESDIESLITLLNESIGFYRDTCQYEKAMACSSEVKDIMEQLDMQGTIPYATTLLNIANAQRAAGALDDSMRSYAQVFEIYDQLMEPADFRYASLFNNLSLLYQEMNDFERASQALERALEIVCLYPEARIEQASTHSNLAASLLKTKDWKRAWEHLTKALTIFEEDEEKDFHYSAALSAMGEFQFRQGNYREAADCIRRAMDEHEAHVGKTESYYRMQDNLEFILSKIQENTGSYSPEKEEAPSEQEEQPKEPEDNTKMITDEEQAKITEAINNKKEETQKQDITEQAEPVIEDEKEEVIPQKEEPLTELQDKTDSKLTNGMQLSKAYFEKNIRTLLAAIPGLEKHAAFGLVGEGSECFGWDDELSRDHDFGPGFCIWLTDEDYACCGDALKKAYDNLPKSLSGNEGTTLEDMVRMTTPQGKVRVGVMKISDFYDQLLGVRKFPLTEREWLTIPEERLCAATNGEVFADEVKEFSQVREYLLRHYPENIRKRKLAQELALMAQTGQYNYKRMLKRGDVVSADMELGDYMKHAMKTVYLLNKVYAPHDKWLFKGMQELSILPEVGDMLVAIHDFTRSPKNQELLKEDNQITMTIEVIAKLIVHELQKQGLSDIEETYLAVQAEHIMTR